MHQRAYSAVALGAALFTSACSDSPLPLETRNVGSGVESIRLSRQAIRLPVGETYQFRVDARSRAGTTVSPSDVRWRTEDPSIAVVGADGVVVPLRAGSTVLFAVAGSRSATAKVETWGNAVATKLELTPQSVEMTAGQSVVASGEITYSNGKKRQVPSAYDWRSADASVATVAAGTITGIGAGTSQVVASVGTLADTAVVSVSASTAPAPAPAPAVTLSLAAATFEVGQLAAPAVTVSDGRPASSLGALVWSIDNAAVATVGSDGIVKGVSAGTAVLRVTIGELAASSVMTVTAPATAAPAPAPAPTPAPEPTPEPAPAPTPAPTPTPSTAGSAELPRVYVDTRMPSVTGRSIAVPAGGSLQAAVDAAQPGDEIVLQAGATYTGGVRLRAKSGDAWIVIRSSGSLPAAGTRVSPSDVPQLARIVAASPSEPIVQTEHGAHHYRLVGLELTAAPGQTWTYTMVTLGDGSQEQNTASKVAHHLILDRVYVHGTPSMSSQRCIALNSGEAAIIDSWIDDCHTQGGESHAIGSWQGTGPYKIVNNHIAGAGINILFGGADPVIPGTIASDIEIRRNHIVKPLSWRGVWTAKNLFELKSAQRVLLEANVMENSWVDAQVGYAMVLWSVNPYGGCTWCGTRDVTIRNNIIRNSAGGFQLTAKAEYGAVTMQRVTIANNVVTGVGNPDLGQNGRMFQVGGPIQDLTIVNNTSLSTIHGFIFATPPEPMPRFVVQNNIFNTGLFSSDGWNARAWSLYAGSGSSFTGNVVIGAETSSLPAGNSGVPSIESVGFASTSSGNYALTASSPFQSSGANVSSVQSFTSGVVR